MQQGYVYILAHRKDGVIYTGVTSDLIQRVYQHKHEITPGFTTRYFIKNLVYYECFESIDAAIHREKRIKKYSREWKINLIESQNPDWRDLYPEILGETLSGLPEQVG